MPRKCLDVRRMSTFGFREKIGLPEGVSRTIREYRALKASGSFQAGNPGLHPAGRSRFVEPPAPDRQGPAPPVPCLPAVPVVLPYPEGGGGGRADLPDRRHQESGASVDRAGGDIRRGVRGPSSDGCRLRVVPGHAMYLAKGGDLKAMMAELYGKATGCARGKGGSMHLIDTGAGVMGTSAVVATTIPLAAGYAFSLKVRGIGCGGGEFLRGRGGRRGGVPRNHELRRAEELAGPFRLREQLVRHPFAPPYSSPFGQPVREGAVLQGCRRGGSGIRTPARSAGCPRPSSDGSGKGRARLPGMPDLPLEGARRPRGGPPPRLPRRGGRPVLDGKGRSFPPESASPGGERPGNRSMASRRRSPRRSVLRKGARSLPPGTSGRMFMASPDHPRILSYPEAIREAMEQEMLRDPSVFLMGQGVDDPEADPRDHPGLLEKFGPERVFDTPLSEDGMTGFAVGAAVAGLRPVHIHIRMDFILLAVNQIVNMAAKMRYMYGGGERPHRRPRSHRQELGQGPQHSQGLYPLFMHIPGLKVVAPATPHDAKGCLIQSIRDDDPVIYVEHRHLYYQKGPVPSEPYGVPFGKARVLREGSDVTIVGVSQMAIESLRAARLLEDTGVRAEVIDPVSLLPLDISTIEASVRKTGRLIVVDNSWIPCGAGAEIIARLAEGGTGRRSRSGGWGSPSRHARRRLPSRICFTRTPGRSRRWPIPCPPRAAPMGPRKGCSQEEVEFKGPF